MDRLNAANRLLRRAWHLIHQQAFAAAEADYRQAVALREDNSEETNLALYFSSQR